MWWERCVTCLRDLLVECNNNDCKTLQISLSTPELSQVLMMHHVQKQNVLFLLFNQANSCCLKANFVEVPVWSLIAIAAMGKPMYDLTCYIQVICKWRFYASVQNANICAICLAEIHDGKAPYLYQNLNESGAWYQSWSYFLDGLAYHLVERGWTTRVDAYQKWLDKKAYLEKHST